MNTKDQSGYTIVELLIVLAVSGAIAVVAIVSIRGQQLRNEFTQSVRDFESKLVDVSNDTAKGYFPDVGGNPECTADDTSGISFNLSPSASVQQGSSEACVFVGKAVELRPDGAEGSMRIQTLAARRIARDGSTPKGLSDLEEDDIAAVPGLEDTQRYLHGLLRVRSVGGAGSISPGTVVFLSSMAGQSASGNLFTGVPSTDVYGLLNSDLSDTQAEITDLLKDPGNYQAPDPGGIEICLEYGDGGRRALLTLSQNGSQLATNAKLESSDPGATGRVCE